MEQVQALNNDNYLKTLQSMNNALKNIQSTVKQIQKDLTISFDSSSLDSLSSGLSSIASLFAIIKGLGFGELLETIGGKLKDLTKFISPILKPLSNLSGKFTTLGKTLAKIGGPLGVVLAIVAALGGGFAYAMKTSEEFREKVSDAFGPLAKTLTKIWEEDISPLLEELQEGFLTFYEEYLKPIIDGVMELFDQLGLLLGEIALDILEDFAPIIDGIAKFADKYLIPLIEILMEKWGEFIKWLAEKVDTKVTIFTGFIKILRGLLNGDMGLIMEGFKDIFDATLGKVWKNIKKWYNDHIAGFFGAKKWDGTFKNIAPCLKDAFKKGLNWVKEEIKDWYETKIKVWFTKEKWASIFRSAVQGIKSAFKLPKVTLDVEWKTSPAWAYEAAKLVGLRGVPDLDFGISYKAKGGFAEVGEMFIAREAGPELVGTMGSRTAVMNNNQIVESVSRGVYDAVASALGANSIGGDWTIQIVDRNGNVRAEDIITAIERRNRRDGKTVIALGV